MKIEEAKKFLKERNEIDDAYDDAVSLILSDVEKFWELSEEQKFKIFMLGAKSFYGNDLSDDRNMIKFLSVNFGGKRPQNPTNSYQDYMYEFKLEDNQSFKIGLINDWLGNFEDLKSEGYFKENECYKNSLQFANSLSAGGVKDVSVVVSVVNPLKIENGYCHSYVRVKDYFCDVYRGIMMKYEDAKKFYNIENEIINYNDPADLFNEFQTLQKNGVSPSVASFLLAREDYKDKYLGQGSLE